MTSGILRWAALGAIVLLLPACGIRRDGTLQPTVAPGIPANVVLRPGNQSATIDWSESAQGARYTVLRSLLPNGPFFPVSVPERFPRPTRYVDPDLTNGTTYYYQVVAVNAFGQSAPSLVVSGTPGFKAIAVSGRLDEGSRALLRDGTVWEWGPSSFSQIIDAPVQVAGLSDITAISSGAGHCLALGGDGRVWGWGHNLSHQLGVDGNVTAPVLVPGLVDMVGVSAGADYSLALTHDGIVRVWGDNTKGEFGTGTTTPADSEQSIEVAGLTDIIAVEAGYSHALALRSDGLVFTWGDNSAGQCGRGSTSTAPLAVGQVPGLTGVVAISTGGNFCLALREDGTVWGWGDSSYGQLQVGGGGGNVYLPSPTPMTGLNGVVRLAAGYYHSVAVLDDGTMKSWGYNYFGALGNGTPGYTWEHTPVSVLGITNAVAAAASATNSIAMGPDGTVYTWGDNFQGQLGNGTGPKTHVPTELKNVTGAVSIAAGPSVSFVVRATGSVVATGVDDFGQLGNGSVVDPPPPDPVLVSGITTATAVSAGYLHSLALDANSGSVWAWGDNSSGQLGNGTSGSPALTPVATSVPSGISTIVCGPYHSLALRSDHTVWTWGWND
ncbi:MAG: hypothetical protein JO332_10410, partial [Planctomycetaceae bacterium]|nr:hypothetical protein [Planctomycetaceae bacterium]